jgi:hypothetical protein
MKKTILLFAFLITTGISFAQKELSKDYSYTVSQPYKVFDGTKFYFSKNDEVLTIKIDGKEALIQKLKSGSDKIAFSSEKAYEDLPKNTQVENAIEYNGKYYFFYSSWDGDKDKEQLFVREIDFEKGEFMGEGKLMFKVDGKVTGSPIASWGFIPIGVQDKFDFLLSLDKKQMLIQYRKKPQVKRDTKSWDIIGMVAYDENMKMTSSNEIKMPYTERRMDVMDYAIDGEGTNYILAKVYHDDSNDDKKRKSDEEANYHIELFRIKNGAKDISDITKVEVNDKFINGLWLYEMPDGKMVCAGYYNIGKKAGSADGMIMFKVGKEGALYDMATYEIPVEVLNEYTPNRIKKRNNKKDEKGEAEFPFLKLRQLIVGSDGSLVLIGEQYFMVTHYSTRYTYTSYHYNDLLVSKIDASGKLSWIKKIPKLQYGLNGKGGMSYKHMYTNGFHYLLFLDNVKNFNLPLDKKPAEHTDGKGGYFTSYKINDADGTMVNSSVFNVRDVDDMTMYQFGTHRIVELTDNSFAVEFYKKKKEDVMVKVEIK